MAKKTPISKKVFEKINSDQVEMKPAYYFLIKSLFWFAVSGLCFLLALALVYLGALLFFDFHSLAVLTINPGHWAAFYPLAAIAIAFVLIYVSARLYRRCRRKCRHEEWMLFGSLVLLAVSWTFFFFSIDEEYLAIRAMEEKAFLKKTVMTPKEYWSRPARGTLSGVVIRKNLQNNIYIIRDWQGNPWMVHTGKCDCRREEIFIPLNAVKMAGEKKEAYFYAFRAWQW